MKNAIKINILLLIILVVQIFAIFQWTACHDFSGSFHFSSFDLSLRLIDGIHSDHNVPLWLVRLFHNKIIGTALDIFAAYLQFWSLTFLAGFISLAGMFGMGAQFYYFFAKKKTLLLWVLFAIVVLIPFGEVLNLVNRFSFTIRIALIALPYLVWSMLGYWKLMQTDRINTKMIDVLIIVSLWYTVALPFILPICGVK